MNKYIKCNIWRLAVRYVIYIYIYIYIYVIRQLKVKATVRFNNNKEYSLMTDEELVLTFIIDFSNII